MSGGTRSKRGRWLWVAVLVFLTLSLTGGLVLTWGVWPIEYYDTDPVDLRAELKPDYLVLIASSFGVDENLERAKRRLEWLGFSEDEAAHSLVGLAEGNARSGADVETTRSLCKLAYALGARDSQVLVFIVTPTPTVTLTPTPTRTPTSTPVPPTAMWTPIVPSVVVSPTREITPTVTATPAETPAARYEVKSKRFVCEPGNGVIKGKGLLEVRVRDTDGTPLTGTSMTVSWSGDEDSFFIGLKPDKGLDYADFEMQPGVGYSLIVDHDTNQLVNVSFRDKDCTSDVVTQTVPVWQVVFERKRPVSGTP